MEANELARFLKRYTRQAHHRVDQHPKLKPLMQAELDLDHYARALAALYPAVSWLEQWVTQALDAFALAYPVVPRAPLLAADIAALGLTSSGKAEAFLSPPMIGVPATKARVLGALYVLEGSRLGGDMIAHHVHQRLGSAAPMRFFTAPHPLGDDFWQVFWCFAVAKCPPHEWGSMGEGALHTFDTFNAMLSPAPRE
ncbi:biliverdin-producing heme oxygenase [Halomonas vilamensis]|uniref:Biliverdin-producing heme oxygenase n=1 Tax=Vreelandella vilamensis TaxID=531309 RepID=A0ABU1H2N2_9GAMM|nr:biliverdin-producing heme oxygenase [Halomonas vilamensis]MDR5898559.1 biliverdin-producing heme oxygenase [Halomonas vilamensis]